MYNSAFFMHPSSYYVVLCITTTHYTSQLLQCLVTLSLFQAPARCICDIFYRYFFMCCTSALWLASRMPSSSCGSVHTHTHTYIRLPSLTVENSSSVHHQVVRLTFCSFTKSKTFCSAKRRKSLGKSWICN